MNKNINKQKWWVSELGLKYKKDVEEQIRTIVKSYKGDKNTPISDEHFEFMMKIFKHHHEINEKTGIGIKHLEVRSNPSWNGPSDGFWIVRNDDTCEQISWVTALSPEGKKSSKGNVCSAARCEISDQIHAFHEHGECNICGICDEKMERGNKLHVDHVIHFDKLFKEFMDLSNVSYDTLVIDDVSVSVTQFNDREIAEKWKEYHKQHSVLRLVHKTCNLKRGKY